MKLISEFMSNFKIVKLSTKLEEKFNKTSQKNKE